VIWGNILDPLFSKVLTFLGGAQPALQKRTFRVCLFKEFPTGKVEDRQTVN
jgi:hypothetical protein